MLLQDTFSARQKPSQKHQRYALIGIAANQYVEKYKLSTPPFNKIAYRRLVTAVALYSGSGIDVAPAEAIRAQRAVAMFWKTLAARSGESVFYKIPSAWIVRYIFDE